MYWPVHSPLNSLTIARAQVATVFTLLQSIQYEVLKSFDL